MNNFFVCLKWELILSDFYIENIHHVVTYECMPSYNGTPAMTDGDSFKNPVKNNYCHTLALV